MKQENTQTKQNKTIKTTYDTIAVIGLGYVGLPLLLELAKKFKTIGFDIELEKINELKNGIDKTNECNKKQLNNTNSQFTSNIEDIKEANIKIVTVPTPIDS